MERKSRKKSLKWINVLVGCILIVIAVVAILMYFMHGQSSFSQSEGSTEEVNSIVCTGNNINYPIFGISDDVREGVAKTNSTSVAEGSDDEKKSSDKVDKNDNGSNNSSAAKKSSELKINMVMQGDKMDTISFIYKQFFDTHDAVQEATMFNRIAMDKSFASDSLGMEALGRTQVNLDDAAQLTLYTERQKINSQTAKYFMLEDASGSYGKDTLMKVYRNKGLKCTEN